MRDRKDARPTIGLVWALAISSARDGDLNAAQARTRLVDDAARLSCYDAAFGVVKPPPTKQRAGAVTTDDHTAFGDERGLLPPAKPALPKSMTAEILQAQLLPSGLYRLTLNNGQGWSTTQADSSLALKPNDGVVISRLLLRRYEISRAGHTTTVSAVRIK